MLQWAKTYLNDNADVAVVILGPSVRKDYYHGNAWDAESAGAMVPLRNIYTVPEFQCFIPTKLLPEQQFRWNGHTLCVVSANRLVEFRNHLGVYPITKIFDSREDIKLLMPMLRRVFVEWPLAIARQTARIEAAIASSGSRTLAIIPRGGLWAGDLVTDVSQAYGRIMPPTYLLPLSETLEPQGANAVLCENIIHPIIVIDETLGTGETLGRALRLLPEGPHLVVTIGSTFEDEYYERLFVDYSISFCLPGGRENGIHYRLVENCPELLGWDIYNGRFRRCLTRLGVALRRDILNATMNQ